MTYLELEKYARDCLESAIFPKDGGVGADYTRNLRGRRKRGRGDGEKRFPPFFPSYLSTYHLLLLLLLRT